jgi:hypothetical protein
MNTSKVDIPNLITDLSHAPIFEWYVVKCGSMNRYQRRHVLKAIGLRAQNMTHILGSIVDIIGGGGLI